MYYIYSKKHTSGYNKTFWRPDGKGYTVNLDEAGLYKSDYGYPIWDGKDKKELNGLLEKGGGNVLVHKDNIDKLGKRMTTILH